jgi:hypothetical protein
VRAHLSREADGDRAGHLVGTEPLGFDTKLLFESLRLLLEFRYIDLHTHLSPQGTGSIAKVAV